MTIDEKISSLLLVIEKKKKEISDTERPSWKTNSFFYYYDKNINIKTINTTEEIQNLLSYLIREYQSWKEASLILNSSLVFTNNNFRYQDWVDDLTCRYNQITIAEKRKELNCLEKRLNNLMSDDLKRAKEINEIERFFCRKLTMYPKVLNGHRDIIPKDAVYIDRPSKYANPFIVGRDGNRTDVVDKYHDWIKTQEKLLEEAKKELRGKNLHCFCAPNPCHGDILLKIVND